jgi:hypothetical protein
MKPEELKLLYDYTSSVNEINRLIVTVFLNCNGITSVNNKYISKLIISESNSDFEKFSELKNRLNIVTLDDLIKAFEFIISPVDKVVTGAVYTPSVIRKYIVDNIWKNYSYSDDFSICDPACGCGGFLLSATEKIKQINPDISYYSIYKNCIFGLDLKEYSAERTKILLHLLAIKNGEDRDHFTLNIFVGNALNYDWTNIFSHKFYGFDVVIGNPPYVTSRNIDEASLELLKNWSVCTTGHPDLYIPFFEIGMSILKKGGILGFITMNTFFKSLNGRALRAFFDKKRFKLSITDFGSEQIFSSKSTYTCICIIENVHSSKITYRKVSHLKELKTIDYSIIKYEDLDHFRGWNLSQTDIISRIEGIGEPLKSLYKINTGIATLKNSVYIINYVSEDEKNFILSCGSKVEKDICVDIVNPNKLIDVSDINTLKKKIIFPYRYADNDARLILSSEFIKKYPNTYAYLSINKATLLERDKGKGNYHEWYAYGRNQGLTKYKYKLLFPHITNKIPNYIISEEDELLFHNGLAILSNEIEPLKILKVIMSSRLFWFYITNTSKPYGSGYYSLSGNYIKAFGIFPFSTEQKDFLLSNATQKELDEFIESLYGINFK